MQKTLLSLVAAFALCLYSAFAVFPSEGACNAQQPPLSSYLSAQEKDALATRLQRLSLLKPLKEAAKGDLLDPMENLGLVRAGFELMTRLLYLPDNLQTDYVDEDGVKGVWQSLPGSRSDRVLLYLHGGAYIMGSPSTAACVSTRLAELMGIRCFSVDYRLAPEHPFPAAIEDAVAAYKWLLAKGYKAENIVLAGDSAGGGLSLALLLKLRDEGAPLPAAALLFSPWTDLSVSLEAHKLNYDPMFTPDLIRRAKEVYLNGASAKMPYASPYYGNFKGLPPLFFQVGSNELLFDDAAQTARKAGLAGVYTQFEVWPGYFHVFQMYNDSLAGGLKALDSGASFLNDAMDKKLLE